MKRRLLFGTLVSAVVCGAVLWWRSPPVVLAPVPMSPPREVRRVEAAALAVYAEAAGLYVVDCPRASHHPEGRSFSMGRTRCVGHPEAWTSLCTSPDPSGGYVVRAGEPERVGPAVSVLRWTTDDAGVTTCREVPAEPHPIPVRVVDPEGRPVEGAVVSGERVDTGSTGPDGRVVVVAWTDDPVSLVAGTLEGGTSGTVVVVPGEAATLTLRSLSRPHEEVLAEADAEHLAFMAEEQQDLEAALSRPDLAPEVAARLELWLADAAKRAREQRAFLEQIAKGPPEGLP